MIAWAPLLLIILGVLLGSPSQGQVLTLSAKVTRIVAHSNQIQAFVERQDLPRLFTYRRLAQNTLNSLQSVGPANIETLQNLQALVLAFRFSESFWTRVSTQRTAQAITHIRTYSQEIARDTGLDRSVYMRVTASILETLYEHLLSLQSTHIPDELAVKISEINPQVGRVLAIARTGDHQRTIDVAQPLFDRLNAMNPLFATIDLSHASFQTIAEIQGLIEYYLAYSRTSIADEGASTP